MSDTEQVCRCGRPTRDAAYFCDQCGTDLAQALGDVAWLEEELETTITRMRGVDYRTKGVTASTERPSPVVWSAADARSNLRGFLIAWTSFCHQEHIRHQSPTAGLPTETLTGMSRWLLWRIDGLALSDFGPAAVEEITTAVRACHRLIDTPQPKQYLGDCQACPDGRLYARSGSMWAVCNTCAATEPAEEVRKKLLESLEDRLCTASEIAQLSTFLGLKADREAVRKHVEYLGRNNLIAQHPAISDTAVYQFGEVYQKLVAKDYGKKVS